MKCAKCGYLGFETGDRCRNCGFDFSLLSPDPPPRAEPSPRPVRQSAAVPAGDTPDSAAWLEQLDRSLGDTLRSADTPVDVQHFLERSLPPEPDEDDAAEESPLETESSGAGLALPNFEVSAADEVTAADEGTDGAELVADEDEVTIDLGAEPAVDPYLEVPAEWSHPDARFAGPDDGRSGEVSVVVAPPADVPPVTPPPEAAAEVREDVVGDLSLRTPEVPFPRVVARASAARGPALPLFGPAAEDDEPPPQLRAQPRPPLAVRRTPDAARVRAIAREVTRQPDAEPALRFADPAETVGPAVAPAGPASAAAGRRAAAAALDVLLLGAIAATVVYLTLRMVGLPAASWRLLPVAPMAGFLGLVLFAYLAAFTAVGGQTIGKMALRIRAVALDGSPLGGGRAVRRALASLVSIATAGLGFLPALVGGERLALHDRLAGTRVVDDPPA